MAGALPFARLLPLALLLGQGLAASPPPPRSSVVMALIDDWGSYDVAWRQKELGRQPQLKTPVLDALVQQGTKLDDYYVQHICTPTRQALMSARYQIHTGLQHGIIQNSQRSCLPPKFGTMADAFKAANFSTHMIGKWHLCAPPPPAAAPPPSPLLPTTPCRRRTPLPALPGPG